jgi:hypothetical protein
VSWHLLPLGVVRERRLGGWGTFIAGTRAGYSEVLPYEQMFATLVFLPPRPLRVQPEAGGDLIRR